MTSLCTVSLILACSITDATFADAKHSLLQPQPVLTLVVRDLAGIDLPTRNIARAQVVRILKSAGVELQWIDAAGLTPPRSVAYLTILWGERTRRKKAISTSFFLILIEETLPDRA